MNDKLRSELDLLQQEYRELLVGMLQYVEEDTSAQVLDEITVFWQKNRRLVRCALNNIAAPFRTYIFSGATIFGVDDNEQYPFLCLGDFHIWDDPIHKYMNTALHSPNQKFNEQLKRQVKDTIQDNIKLIDKLGEKVYILPVRMLTEREDDVIHEVATKAFLSVFKEEMSFEEYTKNFKSIDDIIPALNTTAKQMLIFDASGDSLNTLEERFAYYKNNNDLPLPSAVSDATIFWFAVYGFFAQVVDILLLCTHFQLVPYIRYSVTFRYMLLLAGNYRDVPEVSKLLFKSVVAHTIFRCFDTQIYSQISVSDMCDLLRTGMFEETLFERLAEEGITLDTPKLKRTSDIIDQELSRCLSAKLGEEQQHK